MVQAQNSFKHYIASLKTLDDSRLTKTRRKVNKRSWRGRWYGIGTGLTTFTGSSNGSNGNAHIDGVVGEDVSVWRKIDFSSEEEQEEYPQDLDAEVQDNIADDDEFSLDDDVQEEEPEDPDRQGIIRTVKNAHLVYKRQQENSTFTELWIYNIINKLKSEVDIRRDILAGTDIPAKKTRTPNGDQSYEIWTAGNAQLILIKGLPN